MTLLNDYWVQGDAAIWKLDDGLEIVHPTDFYWLNYPDPKKYETEIWNVVIPLLDDKAMFIDAGANIGLWSCVAAHCIGKKDQVVAIEAGSNIIGMLRDNCERNPVGFQILHRALWSKSGEILKFNQYKQHAGSSLVLEEEKGKVVKDHEMETVCIDEVVGDVIENVGPCTRVVVKLDVEGVEVDALEGATKTIQDQNVVFIYEDHGKDIESETTKEILEKMDLSIYFYDEENEHLIRISDSSQLAPVKIDEKKGYNLFATRPGSPLDQEMVACCKESDSN